MSRQTPILRGTVKQGRIVWDGIDGKRFDVLKRHLEGKAVEVTLQARRKKRSLNQNSYYWGVVIAQIAEAAGYTPEEAHEALRERFLRIHDDSPLPTVRSTTSLTTVEMEEYLANCRQLAAELFGLYIPEPNEVEGEWSIRTTPISSPSE